jgi:hypothetical protein
LPLPQFRVEGFPSEPAAGVARDLMVLWAWGLGLQSLDDCGAPFPAPASLNLPHSAYSRSLVRRVLRCPSSQAVRAMLHRRRDDGALRRLAAGREGGGPVGWFEDWEDPRAVEKVQRAREAWREAEVRAPGDAPGDAPPGGGGGPASGGEAGEANGQWLQWLVGLERR